MVLDVTLDVRADRPSASRVSSSGFVIQAEAKLGLRPGYETDSMKRYLAGTLGGEAGAKKGEKA